MSILDDTDLIPELVAESVAGEAWRAGALPDTEIAPLAAHLAERADQVYAAKHNNQFRRGVNGRGNTGRDYLYMFMRHWSATYIHKHCGAAFYSKLPRGFAMGREPSYG